MEDFQGLENKLRGKEVNKFHQKGWAILNGEIEEDLMGESTYIGERKIPYLITSWEIRRLRKK